MIILPRPFCDLPARMDLLFSQQVMEGGIDLRNRDIQLEKVVNA